MADNAFNLCLQQEVNNLYDMFYTRTALHRRACQHKTAIAIEHMWVINKLIYNIVIPGYTQLIFLDYRGTHCKYWYGTKGDGRPCDACCLYTHEHAQWFNFVYHKLVQRGILYFDNLNLLKCIDKSPLLTSMHLLSPSSIIFFRIAQALSEANAYIQIARRHGLVHIMLPSNHFISPREILLLKAINYSSRFGKYTLFKLWQQGCPISY